MELFRVNRRETTGESEILFYVNCLRCHPSFAFIERRARSLVSVSDEFVVYLATRRDTYGLFVRFMDGRKDFGIDAASDLIRYGTEDAVAAFINVSDTETIRKTAKRVPAYILEKHGIAAS